MELLCPAGNLKAAYSALIGGADAVYIGGKRFSARASAENFTDEEIKEIVLFAHSIGRKIYVTLNILLFQDEFMDAVEFAKFLYTINIDGIIIQDLGLASYLHKTMPDLPLNASTQLNCHNIEQARALKKIGFKRIVLARETDLTFAKKVKELGVEVEVFGHGALCVSYSGNCLLSSFIGNRSGNRGKCAQPCRLQYDLLENGKVIKENFFAISTKDLMTLDYIKDFLKSGIDSLKIEGRLKSNEYIYAVSNAYRHAIDAAEQNIKDNFLDQDKVNLKKIFNRQFTKGYILGESQFSVINSETSSHQGEVIGKVISTTKNRVSIKLFNNLHRLDGIRFNTKSQYGLTVEKMFLNKEPVEKAEKRQIIELVGIENASNYMGVEVIKTKDYLLNEEISRKLLSKLKVNVNGIFYAVEDAPISLQISFNGTSVKVFGSTPQKATGVGTTEERVKEQLRKSGDYPYCIDDLNITIENVFIPISDLNKIRNEAFEALRSELTKVNYPKFKKYKNLCNFGQNLCKDSLLLENCTDIDAPNFVGFNTYSYQSSEFVLNTRVTSKETFNGQSEIVHFPIIKKYNNSLIASPYCNITNSYALDCFYELGFNQCIPSFELDFISLKEMINDFKNRNNVFPNLGLVLYGKIDMMLLHSCPIGSFYNNTQLHCQKCHIDKYELRDRVGEKYLLLGDQNCNTKLFNNLPLYLIDQKDLLLDIGINNFYLIITDEVKEKVIDICNHFKTKGAFNRKLYTRGHFNDRAL